MRPVEIATRARIIIIITTIEYRYLNTEGAGVRNWKDLIAYAPGRAVNTATISKHSPRVY